MATYSYGLSIKTDPQTIAEMTATYRQLAAKKREDDRRQEAAYWRYQDELRERALNR